MLDGCIWMIIIIFIGNDEYFDIEEDIIELLIFFLVLLLLLEVIILLFVIFLLFGMLIGLSVCLMKFNKWGFSIIF